MADRNVGTRVRKGKGLPGPVHDRLKTDAGDSPRSGKKPGVSHFLRRPLARILPDQAGGKRGMVFLFFGVILPVLAVIFELTTHYCAQHFFDPFPSSNHVILFLLIPLSNFLAWLSGRRDMSAHFGFMSLISGMAMGIGCLYALMFLPLTPHSAFYTLFFGFGLLGFAPILSVPCTWLSGKTVCKLAESRRTFFDAHQVEHIGHLIVLCMVVAVELPSTLTRMNLSLAADPATRKQGVQWLRQFGSEEVMLRACYERSGRATDILGSLYEAGHPISIEEARTIFYNVTGKPFNSVPIPAAARATIQHAGLIDDPNGLNADVKDEFDLDSDIAGENVSGVARGLSISKADIHGTVDADAGVADFDWSASFTNSSPYDREARAKLLLPPGSVVSKATVTINGVEHDATILVRSLARTIYKQAVADRRKDPLLVSTCGVNQILIQCYPVQPNAETIVRLHIAAPLIFSADKRQGSLVLPAFEERNFQFERPMTVEFDSNHSGTRLADADATAFEVTPAQIARFGSTVVFKRDPAIKAVVSKVDGDEIEARAVAQAYKRPDKLTVVIDGSASMARALPEVAAALKSLPQSVHSRFVLVSDDVEPLGDNSSTRSFDTALGALANFHPAGGQTDDSQVLYGLALGPVLWIHGPQPINTNSSKSLQADLSKASHSRQLYDFQIASGPNELLNGLEPNDNFVSVPRTGAVKADLERLFSAWSEDVPSSADPRRFVNWQSVNVANSGKDLKSEDAVTGPVKGPVKGLVKDAVKDAAQGVVFRSTSVPGLRELFGYQKFLESYNNSNIAPALILAERYHLVTPVSSAVVLEDVPAAHPAPVEELEKRKGVRASGSASSVNSIDAPAKKREDANFKVLSRLVDSSKTASSDEKLDAAQDASQPQGETVGGSSGQDKEQAQKDLSEMNGPVLSGATNGTVTEAPLVDDGRRQVVDADQQAQVKSNVENEEKPARSEMKQDAGKSLQSDALEPTLPSSPGLKAPTSTSFSLVPPSVPAASQAPPPPALQGAPVDPRYGQSNYPSENNDGWKSISDFFPQPMQMERAKNAEMVADYDPTRSVISNLMQAFSVFALVFMSIYAFFKLLRAILRSRSN